jgi:hypothetical protein
MLNPAAEVGEFRDLHQLLLVTVRQVRTLHATLSALMADVAAVRRTVLQDEEDILNYKNNLLSTLETARPLVDEAMQCYDEMIRQIGDSEKFCN